MAADKARLLCMTHTDELMYCCKIVSYHAAMHYYWASDLKNIHFVFFAELYTELRFSSCRNHYTHTHKHTHTHTQPNLLDLTKVLHASGSSINEREINNGATIVLPLVYSCTN